MKTTKIMLYEFWYFSNVKGIMINNLIIHKMKKHYYLLLILLLLLLCGVGYGLSRRALTKNEDADNTQQVIQEIEDGDDEEVEQKEHLLKLTIISPEGETIFPGQARMYEALLEGNQKYDYARVRCNWKYYLNENNEELLIK